jgi:group I intron endonuclease
VTSGIYRIDLGNGWFYIGSAANLKTRESQHRSGLKYNEHENPKMQNVWNKYGVFKLAILEYCPVVELINREQLHLDKHFDDPKNVNLSPTAGSCLGIIRSVETRAKISATMKGRIVSAETRAKLSAANKNPSADIRAKLSAAQIGRVFSTDTRSKMSSAQKGKIRSAETRAKISTAGRNRVVSAETRAKLVAAWVIRKAQAA